MNQLSQLLILYLTTPGSDFYLSKILATTKDPSLEPYRMAELSLGSIEVLEQMLDLTLRQLALRGISNVQIARTGDRPQIEISGDTVTFLAVRPNSEAPPANVPTDLLIDAQLEINVGGTASPLVPVTVIVKHGTLNGVFLATGDPAHPESVDIKFTSATVAAKAAADNIVFDLSRLESFLRPQVESYVKDPATLTGLIGRMNQELAKPEVLKALSKSGTDAVRGALKQLLGG